MDKGAVKKSFHFVGFTGKIRVIGTVLFAKVICFNLM